MAQSPSELPEGVAWLPAPGGARLLQAPAGLVLVLATDGGEHRVGDGSSAGEYLVSPELVSAGWEAAWLEGGATRVALPPLPHAEIVAHADLAARRARRFGGLGDPPSGAAASPPTGAASPSPGGPTEPSPPLASVVSPPPASPSAPAAASPPAAAAPSSAASSSVPSSARSAPAWTAPPRAASADGSLTDTEWLARRATLERELARASEALAAARDSERADREAVLAALAGAQADLRAARQARDAEASAVAVLTGELEAERNAHAVTRARAARLADELAIFRQASTGETDTLLERVAQLDRAAAGLRDQVDLERRAREQAEAAAAATRRPPEETGRLVADLDAAAAALRRSVAAPPESAADEPDAPAAVAPDGAAALDDATGPVAPDAAAAPTPARAVAPAPPPPEPDAPRPNPARLAQYPAALTRRPRHLRRALIALARQDARAAAELLVALLPAQGGAIGETLAYDLTVREIGTFAVDVSGGTTHVRPIEQPRARKQARFHLDADALTLAELLAGEPRKLKRFGPRPKLSGRRRKAKSLRELPNRPLSLTQALAQTTLEPELIYRALPFAIDPQWTRGYVFTVAQEIADRVWYVSARDGAPVSVTQAYTPPNATVSMTPETFALLLKGEPTVHGARPVVRGDLKAVAALKAWTDRARG